MARDLQQRRVSRIHRRFIGAAVLMLFGAGLTAVTTTSPASGAASAPAADTCGYSGTGTSGVNTLFNESTVTRALKVYGQGLTAHLGAYANDETSLLLGVGGATAFVNPGPNDITNPPGPLSVGSTSALDAYGRPQYPTLFITRVVPTALTSALVSGTSYTSLSVNALGVAVATGRSIILSGTKQQAVQLSAPAAIGATTLAVNAFTSNAARPVGTAVLEGAGDWQVAGNTYRSTDINGAYGTWATATVSGTTYTVVKPTTKNNWNLGTGSDVEPAAFYSGLGTNEGYGTEITWNVNNPNLTDETGAALVPGAMYRFQVMTHDGDQNKTGGDVGEFCTTLTLPGPPTVTTKPSATAVIPNADPNSSDGFSLQAPINSSVSDFARFTGNNGAITSGTVTYKLYFQTNPQPATPCATAASTPPGTLVFTDANRALTFNADGSATATSASYDTSVTDHSLGTYYWQDTYNPPVGGGNYTTFTEACGRETVQIMDARTRINPPSAVNIVGVSHTLTATVETTVNGTTWTPVSGAVVTFAYQGTTSATPVPPTGCSTGLAGTCTTTINDAVAETVTVRATATAFYQAPSQFKTGNDPNLGVGPFTRATGAAGCVTDGCDAVKTYINPRTTLSVTDRLDALPSSATGSVSYLYWTDDNLCGGSGTSAGGGGAVVGGVSPLSGTVTVAPGHTVYFEVVYTAGTNDPVPGFHTACTAEQATSN